MTPWVCKNLLLEFESPTRRVDPAGGSCPWVSGQSWTSNDRTRFEFWWHFSRHFSTKFVRYNLVFGDLAIAICLMYWFIVFQNYNILKSRIEEHIYIYIPSLYLFQILLGKYICSWICTFEKTCFNALKVSKGKSKNNVLLPAPLWRAIVLYIEKTKWLRCRKGFRRMLGRLSAAATFFKSQILRSIPPLQCTRWIYLYNDVP